MKIRVKILTRKQTLNPADNAILGALRQMGHDNVTGLRLGRFFEVEVDDSRTSQEWREFFDKACRDVRINLANPVLEEWQIEVCQ